MNQERKKKIIEFWKKILFHNLSIKILSIIGAGLVWLLIMNIDDPYKTRNFVVQVETINEDAIHSVNKVYEVIEGSTASVSVRGKRSVVDELESDDISATADLSELSEVNAVAIKVRLKKNVSSDVALECSQVLKVSLEDMETKQVKVTVDTEGTPADGYSVGECTARPNVIEVTGGGSVIDRISSVRVTINVNGASQNFTKMLEPIAYDKRGNRVTSSTMSFSNTKVKVRAKLLQNKTVPVKVKVSGKPAKGYEYISTSCLPEKIEIAGSEKSLADVSEIVIPIDITGLTSTSAALEQEITVSDYLADDITVPEEYQKVSVQIAIEELSTRRLQLQPEQLQFSNVGSKYEAELYDSSSSIDIILSGRKSVLSELSEHAILASVDCEGLTEGTYRLPVQMNLEEDCSIEKGARIKVVIRRKKSASAKATPSPDVTAAPSPRVTTSPSPSAAATQQPQPVETQEPTVAPEEEEE